MDGIGPMADFGLRPRIDVRGDNLADWGHGTNPQSEIRNPQSDSVDRTDEQKKQIARDFESVLLTRLFDEVQKSLGSGDLEEDGTSQQVQGLFWFYLARDAADKGGFGLWQEIYQQLQQMEGTANPAEVLKCEM